MDFEDLENEGNEGEGEEGQHQSLEFLFGMNE